MSKFSGGKAIFRLFSEQADHLQTAADALTLVANATPEERVELNAKLHKIENKADEASHAVQHLINKSFVLPYDRIDLFTLCQTIDDCVDLIDEAGDNMVLYKVGELPRGAHKLVQIISECAAATTQAMHRLNKLDDTMRAYWVGINQLENHGDTVYRSLISDLFSADGHPMELLKMKFVIDKLESAIDRFEHLAGVVESIALKES
ncbi:DUF47 domain-containing protein [Arcanobacterium sp. S3PF19]|uniref:DUF47 domain-containing protein n=1 Tax=Arcanobacterium sp. S3PF19 TaxID=1219585 RepID=UPI00050FB90B|nr:DUF47 family protein [Arcanobacterium sp. S3PF19]KGF05599.1 hypothetical protein HMPREF1631_04805 [Arcanobacterium sp. S3PF19]